MLLLLLLLLLLWLILVCVGRYNVDRVCRDKSTEPRDASNESVYQDSEVKPTQVVTAKHLVCVACFSVCYFMMLTLGACNSVNDKKVSETQSVSIAFTARPCFVALSRQ